MQTRRPIPFECRTDGEAERVSVRYREHPEAPWQTLELEPEGGAFRGTLPCERTMNSGRLEFFVVATDAAGDPLDTLGSKSTPERLVLNPQSRFAPSFPGEAPPARCAERVLCPPEFPGCEDPTSARPAQSTPAAARPQHWLSLHAAADVGFTGGSNVCTSSNSDYECYAGGSETPFPPPLPEGVAATPGELGEAYPGTDLAGGAAVGTWRVLVGYDRALGERVSLGGRLGFAFGGGPPTLDGDSFFPVHIEARLAWWPRGIWGAAWRPYVHLGAGLAQVDLSEEGLDVRDCSEEPDRASFLDCLAAAGGYAPEAEPDLPTRRLDAWRKLGDAFVTGGGGLLLTLSERAALQINLNAMLMLPSVGVVLQPSLGLVYGL